MGGGEGTAGARLHTSPTSSACAGCDGTAMWPTPASWLRRAAADAASGRARRRSCRGRARVDCARRAVPGPVGADGDDPSRRGPAWPVCGSPALSCSPSPLDPSGLAPTSTCSPKRRRGPDRSPVVAPAADAHRARAASGPGGGAVRHALAASHGPSAPVVPRLRAPSRCGSRHHTGSGSLAPAAAASPRSRTPGHGPRAERRSPRAVRAPPPERDPTLAPPTPRRHVPPRARPAQCVAQATPLRPALRASACARCAPRCRRRTRWPPPVATPPRPGARAGRGSVWRQGHGARAEPPTRRPERLVRRERRVPHARRLGPAGPRTPQSPSAAAALHPWG